MKKLLLFLLLMVTSYALAMEEKQDICKHENPEHTVRMLLAFQPLLSFTVEDVFGNEIDESGLFGMRNPTPYLKTESRNIVRNFWPEDQEEQLKKPANIKRKRQDSKASRKATGNKKKLKIPRSELTDNHSSVVDRVKNELDGIENADFESYVAEELPTVQPMSLAQRRIIDIHKRVQQRFHI